MAAAAANITANTMAPWLRSTGISGKPHADFLRASAVKERAAFTSRGARVLRTMRVVRAGDRNVVAPWEAAGDGGRSEVVFMAYGCLKDAVIVR